jgi:hypothetical protein
VTHVAIVGDMDEALRNTIGAAFDSVALTHDSSVQPSPLLVVVVLPAGPVGVPDIMIAASLMAGRGPVLAIVPGNDPDMTERALAWGARAVWSRSQPESDLRLAIRTLLRERPD